MTCPYKPKTYYDLDLLKSSRLPIDKLVQGVVSKHKERLKKFQKRNNVWPNMFDVTVDLVNAFKHEAYVYVQKILENTKRYGYLYLVTRDERTTEAYFDVDSFQLVRNRWEVLRLIKKQAEWFSKPDTHHFDATCLYLIYFYALLVNPEANWITMDYINGGNRYHQYGTGVNWETAMPSSCIDTRPRPLYVCET